MNIKLKDGTLFTLSSLLENILRDTYFYKTIENPSEELTIELLKSNSFVLALVEKQTELMCLTAVKNNFKSLEYVKNKNLFICLEAAKNFKSSMKYRSGFDNLLEEAKLLNLIPSVEASDIDDCIIKIENKIKLQQLIK